MASLTRLNYYYTYYGLHDGHAVMRAALAEEVVRVHAWLGVRVRVWVRWSMIRPMPTIHNVTVTVIATRTRA